MESSVSSLTYKGSISEAISEAQRQKKLLLVYISGDDENSTNLETSTWMDSNVADAITKECIFLHLVDGTIDACNFTSIFPQKSVPSISAVGYNGVMLWNHEGYIDADNIIGSIVKACTSLKLQETAATLLSAALASRKNEFSNSSTTDVATSSRPNDDPLRSTENKSQYSEDVDSQLELQNRCQNRGETSALNSAPSSSATIDVAASDLGSSANSNNISISTGNLCKQLDDQMVHPELIGGHGSEKESELNEKNGKPSDIKNDGDPQKSKISQKGKEWMVPTMPDAAIRSQQLSSLSIPENINAGPSSKSSLEAVKNAKIWQESLVSMSDEAQVCLKKSDESINHPNILKSTEIHLNIRLSDGSSLQAKFLSTDTLRLVKKYVNEKQKCSSHSYELAVPYPRRVFIEEDMEKSLSDLGFSNREALIIIPSRHATILGQNKQSSPVSSNGAAAATDDDNSQGYFGYLKRLVSYFNPFSYFGRSAHSSASDLSENDNFLQNSTTSMRTSSVSDNSFTARRQQQGNISGSNIRTLRDLEGDGPSSDRNTYWNGNSTEFGGNDKN